MEWAMPSEDRDRQLEKALARHLRSTFDDSACPDAETLAAYQDGTLLLEEMAGCKQHIAACPRCQETLALVEESNVLKGSAEENRKMLEPVSERLATAAASHTRLGDELFSLAAPPVLPGSSRKPKPMRAASLRWVVPVGALAAGLLVWVSWRETPQKLVMQPAVEVAENHPSRANVPAPPLSTPQQIPSQLPKQSATERVAKPSGAVDEKTETSSGAARQAIPTPDKGKELAELRRQDELSASGMPPAPSAPPEVHNYAGQNRELPSTQMVQPTAAATNDVAANSAASGRLLGQQNQKAKMPTRTTENLQASSATVAISQSLNDVLPEGGIIIMAPVEAYSWRVGPGGKIEHSTDGSRTWMLQKSGVTTDLNAGSAISGKVCWVVGKAGTILLTTDRGRHWKQLPSPTKEDLAGVNALDEKRASIWSTSRTKSFETNDGGSTWTPVGNK
jgi:anti-sigma factor RsiW